MARRRRRGVVFVRNRAGGHGQPRLRQRFELPGGTAAPAQARDAVDGLLGKVGPALHEDLRLLVSELVTNSIRHATIGAQDTLGLVLWLSARKVRVEVHDPGPGFDPGAVSRGAEATAGGWGLVLLDRVADRWGVELVGSCCVWFEIDRTQYARRAG